MMSENCSWEELTVKDFLELVDDPAVREDMKSDLRGFFKDWSDAEVQVMRLGEMVDRLVVLTRESFEALVARLRTGHDVDEGGEKQEC